MNRIALALGLLLNIAVSGGAAAQTACKYIAPNAVLTASQWNWCFQQKNDSLGFNPVNKAGDVMLGRLVFPAPTGSFGNFSLTPGSAPSAPADGDLWVTTAGLWVRANGTTIGPLSGPSSAAFAATAPLTVSFPSSVVTYGLSIDTTLKVTGANLGIDPSHANSWSGQQTFAGGVNLAGSTSGNTLLKAAATASGTVTLPAGTTDFSATGGTGQYVKQSSAGAALTVAGIASSDLPVATSSAFGAVKPDNTTITVSGGVISVGTVTTTPPTTQAFLSGSGTYTTPANVRYIRIKMIGGGGGGGGGAGGAGTAGGASCWNSSGAACTSPLFSAGGGTSVASGSGTASGGTCSGAYYLTIIGGNGGAAPNPNVNTTGAMGGNGFYGGGGAGGVVGGGGGGAAQANTGAGAGGAGGNGSNSPGAGGGAGCYLEAQINNPAASYTYAVGGGGTGGTGSPAGGAGGSGRILVEEYY